MQLKYSNRKLWTMVFFLTSLLATVFILFSVALYRTWWLALVFFSVGLWFVLWAIRFFSITDLPYVEIEEGICHYYLPFKRKQEVIHLSDVRLVKHEGHQLLFFMSGDAYKVLPLNYLCDKDMKKLLMYLQFSQSKDGQTKTML